VCSAAPVTLCAPTPADLISLLTIYNAAFAVLGVWLIDGGLPSTEELPNPSAFATAVVATAVTGLTAAVLYQRALSIAPLSLTVPYLAFAPVFVVSACSWGWGAVVGGCVPVPGGMQDLLGGT
jgi:hypothetical protein